MNQLIYLILPLGLALLFGRLIISLYTKRGWVDDPKKSMHPKNVHTTPLPRGGGLVVGIAMILSILALFQITPALIGILIGLLVLALLGFWDDIADPHPILRLSIQIVVACVPVIFGVSIRYITNPFGGIISFDGFAPLAFLLTVFWIVWCMNIVNFSTGLDGQMPGYIAIAALTIALLSTRFFPDPNQVGVFQLSLLVAGTYLGFLYWNKYPQKMMSGFGASTLAGFSIAVVSILSSAKLATAILVLAIPMVDAMYVIMRRIWQKKSPLWGDRSHLHHALLDRGWSKSQVAYLYWASALVLGLLSLGLSSGQKVFAILLIIAIVCMIGTWLRLGMSYFVKSDRDSG